MKIKIYILIIVVLINFSCAKQKNRDDGVDVKTIELNESKDFLPISSFISDLRYMELKVAEVNKKMGEIQDIKVFDKDLIIKHRRAGQVSFTRFTADGEYINEIVNNSKGDIPNPLDISPYRKDYAVLDKNGIHLVSKQGEYKGVLIAQEMTGRTFFETDDRFYVINEMPSEDFLTVYTGRNKVKKIEKLNDRMNRLIYSDVATDKGSLNLFSSFSDVIYEYSNGRTVPKYKLKSGAYPTLSQVWKTIGDRDERETIRYLYETQHVLVKNYLENDEIIFLTYQVGSHSSTVIIKKEFWRLIYYAQAVNDIDGGIWDKPLYISHKNELYIPLGPSKISGHKISNKRHHDFEHLQVHIAASGNPVIMVCKME